MKKFQTIAVGVVVVFFLLVFVSKTLRRFGPESSNVVDDGPPVTYNLGINFDDLLFTPLLATFALGFSNAQELLLSG